MWPNKCFLRELWKHILGNQLFLYAGESVFDADSNQGKQKRGSEKLFFVTNGVLKLAQLPSPQSDS